MQRGTPEYEAKKQQRSEALWRAVERCIPDIHERTEIKMVSRGTHSMLLLVASF